MTNTPALETSKLTMQFGGLRAVDAVDLCVPAGSIFGLIGPNGAGKTTFFNMLTGVYSPTSGSVQFNGKVIGKKRPFEITRLGLARTFQNIRLFKDLTVEDNILVSMDNNPKMKHYSLVETVFRSKRVRSQETQMKDKARDILRVFELDTRRGFLSRNLPYGDQRRLEIARAIATGAQILLLDEPAAGMNHNETDRLMKTIKQVRKDYAITVLLIEHDMKLVMGVCERIAVLDYGVKIAEGEPQEIQKNEKVIEAYLGKSNSEGSSS